jgi:undecaprenyl-diphosphatase
LEKDTLIFDQNIANFIYSWRSPGLTKLMIFVTNLGANYMIVIAILTVIFLVWKKHKKEAITFGIILVMGVIINFSLKQIIQRPRPEMSPLIMESSYSFPSGHAMNATVFYLALAFYFYHFTRKKKLSLWVTVTAIGLIILIGFSRIYLGVHYPSDVAAGYAVGVWWLVTAILINKSISWRNLFKKVKWER